MYVNVYGVRLREVTGTEYLILRSLLFQAGLFRVQHLSRQLLQMVDKRNFPERFFGAFVLFSAMLILRWPAFSGTC
jgi:hypothetical protein